jgi:antitoxin ParD1/3/4
MAQMNISIPEKLKSWVEARVSDGSYSSTSDYVRDLLRADQRYQAQLNSLRADIQAGRESGISDRSLQEIVAEARAKYKARAED